MADIPEIPTPITREEVYLYHIAKNGGGGGGGGGTTVIANPDEAATDVLKKIKVDSKVYGIESGGGELADSLTASVDVGGVESGDSFAAGTSVESVLKAILSPTLYPTFTAPSAVLTASGSKLIESGATLPVTFTVAFDRGAITPSYGTSGYRAGEAQSYTLDGTTQSGNSFTRNISSAKTSWQASVSYAAGDQPKDSTGNDYDTALPAGSVNTNIITYEFVDAIWANTGAINAVAKLALISKAAGQKDFNYPAQTLANPEIFDIPASWNVTDVQVKNDLSGQWEDAAAQFSVSAVMHDDAAGNAVNYNRYTFNLGYDTGARSVRVKWN